LLAYVLANFYILMILLCCILDGSCGLDGILEIALILRRSSLSSAPRQP
jgi:hypothetical protein